MISQDDIDAFKEEIPQRITAEYFKQATGMNPENDDLERCNCHLAGTVGHYYCGWNHQKNRPYFMGEPHPNSRKDR